MERYGILLQDFSIENDEQKNEKKQKLLRNEFKTVGEYNRSDKNKKCYHVYTRSKASGLLYDIKGAHSEHEIEKNKLRLRKLGFNDRSFIMCTNNADYPPIFNPIINYVKNKIERSSEEKEF